MKNLLILFLVSTFLILSCRSTGSYYNQQLNEVRYFQTTIHRIDRDVITFANGTKWKTNRFIIAVNMTDVFVVVNQLDIGEAFINKTRYSISITGENTAYRYFRGYSNILKTTYADNNIIELSDGSTWQVVQKGDVDLNEWLTTSSLIVGENENIMINPQRIEAIKVNRIEPKDKTEDQQI